MSIYIYVCVWFVFIYKDMCSLYWYEIRLFMGYYMSSEMKIGIIR